MTDCHAGNPDELSLHLVKLLVNLPKRSSCLISDDVHGGRHPGRSSVTECKLQISKAFVRRLALVVLGVPYF
jgi:hypothetical protein